MLKMWGKLNKFTFKKPITRVDFNNILRTALTSADPKSAKKTDCLTVFFALWGSARVKAAH